MVPQTCSWPCCATGVPDGAGADEDGDTGGREDGGTDYYLQPEVATLFAAAREAQAT